MKNEKYDVIPNDTTKSRTFSATLGTKLAPYTSPFVVYLDGLDGTSGTEKLLNLWNEFTAARDELTALRETAATGSENIFHYLSDDEAALIKTSFGTPDGGLDTAKIAAAMLTVARREATRAESGGQLGVTDKRISETVAEMMRLNKSISDEKWFLRESINSKSISVAARVNIPAALEYIKNNQADIDAHNNSLRPDAPFSTYFNRQARKAAKIAGAFKTNRVRCTDDSGEWEIKIIEEEI